MAERLYLDDPTKGWADWIKRGRELRASAIDGDWVPLWEDFYSQDQPRDDHGRFTNGGGGGSDHAEEDLHQAIFDWTGGGYRYDVLEANAVLNGEGSSAGEQLLRDTGEEHERTAEGQRENALLLLGAIHDAPANAPELLRGMNSSSAEEYGVDFRAGVKPFLVEGGTVDLPLASFTEDPNIAYEYSKSYGGLGSTDVMLHLDAGAQAISVAGEENNAYASEKEWVTSGRFQVTRVQEGARSSLSGMQVAKYDIYLHQLDTFEVPK